MKLYEIASVVRSKNAGPFFLTFDVMFPDKATYEKVKPMGILNKKLMSDLYNIPLKDIRFYEFSPAFAFKWTIRRPIYSGDVGDSDIYGAQQHAHLMNVEIPI